MQGVVVYMRVMDGVIRRGDSVKLMNTKKEVVIDELGVLSPKPVVVSHSALRGFWLTAKYPSSGRLALISRQVHAW